MNDEEYMREAICIASKAKRIDEVPIGAVIVYNGKIIAKAHNRREIDRDATAHAEMLAIKKACKKLKSWRLIGCDLYVTLEPCPMCAGAIVNSRIDRLIFGAYDPKAGCAGTLFNIPQDERFNHRIKEVKGGVLERECAGLVSDFFKEKRKTK